MPYYQEHLTARGIIATTCESAITWDRFPAFREQVMSRTMAAAKRIFPNHPSTFTCRFTHVYPDGPAPYFTFHALADKPKMIEQYAELKHEMLGALVDNGGTITHHHAVGRYHRPWYDKQRPELFARALRAAKKELDPTGMLNPGVLIDP
jgi:alkyldihydroxyacetonephosphate synthase